MIGRSWGYDRMIEVGTIVIGWEGAYKWGI